VNVLVCLSNDDSTIDGITSAKGYVQDVLRARCADLELSGRYVFAVGANSMVDALRRVAPEVGIDPRRVLTNHNESTRAR
jgi:NAD(P)H-flavin reductase